MIIKVCGLRDNVKAVARLKPDLLGFIFHSRSPRDASALPTDVFAGLPAVAVTVNRTPDEINDICRPRGISRVQLHGDESPDMCFRLRAEGYTVIKAFGIDSGFDMHALHNYAGSIDMALLDTRSPLRGGTGEKFPWDRLNDYPTDGIPFLLSGGIGPSDALTLPSHPLMAGIDINSRFEIRPALKSIVHLQQFIEQIRKNYE